MAWVGRLLCSLAISAAVAACGLVYQAHTELRTSQMLKSLEPGQSTLDVHDSWGEPDIRNYLDDRTQVWSYGERTNTNDVTAALLYTAPKEGDTGHFLDLRFVNGRLAAWSESDHVMPEKNTSGFSYGVGSTPFGAVHY